MAISGRELGGRVVLSCAILVTLAVTLVVDWTTSHVVDPEWPPHARFHVVMYHGTLLVFALAALWWL